MVSQLIRVAQIAGRWREHFRLRTRSVLRLGPGQEMLPATHARQDGVAGELVSVVPQSRCAFLENVSRDLRLRLFEPSARITRGEHPYPVLATVGLGPFQPDPLARGPLSLRDRAQGQRVVGHGGPRQGRRTAVAIVAHAPWRSEERSCDAPSSRGDLCLSA